MTLDLWRMREVVMKVASFLGVLCFLAVCCGSATAEVNSQQQAVTRLKSERNKIVNCAAKLKTHGDRAQREAGAEDYQNAKAKIDEVFRVLAANLMEEAEASMPARSRTKFRPASDSASTSVRKLSSRGRRQGKFSRTSTSTPSNRRWRR